MESTNPKDAFGKLKPSLTSIPPVALVHMGLAMMNGAKKYGPYNWRAKTVAARVYLDAAMRHIVSWLDGEENAADSGIHHLGHALASLGIILDAQANDTLVDDRPLPGGAARLLEQFTQSAGGARCPAGSGECEVPPAGWKCSRSEGHEGPCAAMPDGAIYASRVVNPTDWSPQDNMLLGSSSGLFAVSPGSVQIEVNGVVTGTMRQRRVYIAGPMRGYKKFNFPAFDRARDLAISKGYNPISPADMDRKANIHEDTVVTLDHATIRTFVDRDTDALREMRAENGDAIALLMNWERSTGAVAEFFLARWLGLEVLNAVTMEPFTEEDIEAITMIPLNQNIRKTLGSKA